MSRAPGLSSTSYVVLGLLAVRPWSAYELAGQIERGWRDLWPRAGRGIYHEPKKLVSHGYATARSERSGRRRRTVYEAAEPGRRALAVWLAAPSVSPGFESEALVRVAFADHGALDDLRVAIGSLREHALERSAALLAQGEDYRLTGGPFPDRIHLLHLVGGFLAEQHAATIRWADWAEAHIDGWETTTAPAPMAQEQLGDDVAALMTSNLQAAGQRAPTGCCLGLAGGHGGRAAG